MKRGQANILVIVLVIVLVLVAIAIVWNAFKSTIIQSLEGISTEQLKVDLNIESAYIESDNQTIFVSVKRETGEGNITALKFIFTDSSGVKYIYRYPISDGIPKELETRVYNITVNAVKNQNNLNDFDFSDIVSVGIAFEFKTGSGKTQTSGIKDEFKEDLREDSSLSGAVNAGVYEGNGKDSGEEPGEPLNCDSVTCETGYHCYGGECIAGNVYYADANLGDDSNDGSSAHPWKTATKAGNTAVAGDTVIFGPGTYNQQLAPAHSGTVGNMITFKAATRRTAILDGAGAHAVGVSLNSKNYIRIEGFEIRNWSYDPSGIDFEHGNHLEFVDNLFHDGIGPALSNYYGQDSTDILIENNTVHDMIAVYNINPPYEALDSPRAFWVYGTNIIIRGNNVYHNGDDAIFGSGNNWLIEDNNFTDSHEESTHQDAMDLGSLTNSIIRNNILRDFTQLIYFHFVNGNNADLNNVSIYGNTFSNVNYYPSTCPGIYVSAQSGTGHKIRNLYIHSNTFGYLGSGSIIVSTNTADATRIISNINIYDNIFTSNGISTDAQDAGAYTSNYNLFNTGVSMPSFEGSHSINNINPNFVDYAVHDSAHLDMHLNSNSPAIDAGNLTGISLPSPFVDIDGVSRSQNGKYDIGAYEYNGAPATGNTYYLDANNGNDAWNGNSTKPWKTLAHAQSVVISGDTVTVANGSYGEYNEAYVDRTDWVTYRAAPGNTPELTTISIDNQGRLYDTYLIFDGFTIRPAITDQFPVSPRNANHIKFLNLNIIGQGAKYTQNGIRCWGNWPSVDLTIDGCNLSGGDKTGRFDGFVTAIDIGGSDYITITNNEIKQFSSQGILVGCVNGVIQNNNIHYFGADAGLGIGSGNGPMLIENNKVHDNILYQPILTEVPIATTWSDDGKTMYNPTATWEVNEPINWGGGGDIMEINVLSGNNVKTGDQNVRIESVVSPHEIKFKNSIAFTNLNFTSGGPFVLGGGYGVISADSGAEGVIEDVALTSGSWALGTAAGTLKIYSKTGVFKNEALNTYNSGSLVADVATAVGDAVTLKASNVDYIIISATHTDLLQVYAYGIVSNLTIRNNQFYDTTGQIWWMNPLNTNQPGNRGGSNFLIENNLFQTTYSDEVRNHGQTPNIVAANFIDGLVFRNNTIIGQLTFDGCANTQFYNNIVEYINIGDSGLIYNDYNIMNRGWIASPFSAGAHDKFFYPNSYSWDKWNASAFTNIFTNYYAGNFSPVMNNYACNGSVVSKPGYVGALPCIG